MDATIKKDVRVISCEDLHCFVCFEKVSAENLPYNDIGWNQYKLFNNLKLYHCSSCGFGFSLPELSQERLNLFYEKEYRAKNSTFHLDFNKPLKIKGSKIRKKIAGSRNFPQIVLARVFCKFDKGDHFLNIGPGEGGSFRMAKALLNQPSLHAIEKSEGAQEYYRKYFGVSSHDSLTDFIRIGKKAKILVMSHSLEHFRISDLNNLFIEISSLLDDDGVIIIEVPHVDLRVHANIRGADTPHLLFFSKQSLVGLLSKFNFDVLFADTCDEEYISNAQDQKKGLHSLSSKIKTPLKKIYNNAPISIQGLLRTLDRSMHFPKNYINARSPQQSIGKFPQHSYGGNRVCLRVVAKKSLNQ